MNAEKMKTIREAIDAFDRVVAMTYDPNDHDEPHPDYSAADVFEAVCNLHTHVYEAYRAITTIVPQPPVNAQVLKAMLDLLAIAEQGDPADVEEGATLEAARAAARSVKAEACEPCPDCTAAEQLCESCGGHGYVPKATPKPHVLFVIYDGVGNYYANTNDVEIHKVDIDSDLDSDDTIGYETPEAFRELAKEAGILDSIKLV